MSAADHRLKGLDRVGFERLQDALLKQGSGMLAAGGAGGGGGVGCAATSSLKLTLVNADNPRDASGEVVPVETTLAEARQLAAATFGFEREAQDLLQQVVDKMDEQISTKRRELDAEYSAACEAQPDNPPPRKLVDGISGFEYDDTMLDLTDLQQTKHHAVWTGLRDMFGRLKRRGLPPIGTSGYGGRHPEKGNGESVGDRGGDRDRDRDRRDRRRSPSSDSDERRRRRKEKKRSKRSDSRSD